MTTRDDYRPTWHPAALEPGLRAWLAQVHTPQPQGSAGLAESRAHPDYARWRYMLDTVSTSRYLVSRS